MTWVQRLKCLFGIDIESPAQLGWSIADHCLFRRYRGYRENPQPSRYKNCRVRSIEAAGRVADARRKRASLGCIRAPRCRSGDARRSAGRSNARANGRDQAIKRPFTCLYAVRSTLMVSVLLTVRLGERFPYYSVPSDGSAGNDVIWRGNHPFSGLLRSRFSPADGENATCFFYS